MHGYIEEVTVLAESRAFSGFAVDDIDKARRSTSRRSG